MCVLIIIDGGMYIISEKQAIQFEKLFIIHVCVCVGVCVGVYLLK